MKPTRRIKNNHNKNTINKDQGNNQTFISTKTKKIYKSI